MNAEGAGLGWRDFKPSPGCPAQSSLLPFFPPSLWALSLVVAWVPGEVSTARSLGTASLFMAGSDSVVVPGT